MFFLTTHSYSCRETSHTHPLPEPRSVVSDPLHMTSHYHREKGLLDLKLKVHALPSFSIAESFADHLCICIECQLNGCHGIIVQLHGSASVYDRKTTRSSLGADRHRPALIQRLGSQV